MALKRVYEALSKSLSNWSVFRGYNIEPPVLIIDEANQLDALLESGGRIALDDFFAWLVENTKQTNRFHVVMASSDSFFLKWINQFVNSGVHSNYVVILFH